MLGSAPWLLRDEDVSALKETPPRLLQRAMPAFRIQILLCYFKVPRQVSLLVEFCHVSISKNLKSESFPQEAGCCIKQQILSFLKHSDRIPPPLEPF